MNLLDAGKVIGTTLITLSILGVIAGIICGGVYLDSRDKADVTARCCAPKGNTLAQQTAVDNHWWAICRQPDGVLVLVDEGK
jgi:hypothetical protein